MLAIENIRDLETFCSAAKEGSFSAAARELGVTQPAVSQAVARLESQLGVTLFDRNESGRAAFLTDAGAVLLAHTLPALDELSEAARDLAELKGFGPVRVGMPSAFALHYFPDGFGAISAVQHEHPVEITLHDSRRLEDEIRHRRLDIGLIGSADEGIALPHASFAKVATYPLMLAIRQQDTPSTNSLSLRELARREAPIVGYSGDRFLREAVNRVLSHEGLQLNMVAETDQIEPLYQMVALGMGIGLSSQLVFEDAPQSITLLGASGANLPSLNIFVFEDTLHSNGPNRTAIGAIKRLLFAAVKLFEDKRAALVTGD